MQEGLISVIIPTYNRAHLLPETLASIESQTYKNWECIIVDDGSTDNTEEIILSHSDSRFVFYKRPKERQKGANACRNYGFKKSNGEYINWFDSDDLMHPDFLKLKVEELETDLSLDFCACVGQKFIENTNEEPIPDPPKVLNSKSYIEDYLLNGLFFYTPSPLWRYKFLETKDLFDESLHRSQERDFHFRMLTYQPKYLHLETVLFNIRTGIESISEGASKSIIAQKSIFKYFDGVFTYLKNNQNEDKREKLMSYVFYRQTTNYYNINQLCNNFSQRFNIFKSYSKHLISYVFTSKKLKTHFFKIVFGLIMVLVTNKGYKFFYFPEYDYVKKNE
ncbi:glycosyltransferase family A protein [Winogradskyella sp.]|uniref:glycosyltransferase family A protein n=1 Tax=Winogradskyella sp. TaxID=1883156 RepID=UPI0025CFC732|nr:glycosyltransferase family A protein [Winogradskyella sp.]